MFNQVLLTILDQKAEYIKLKQEDLHTPLENSINSILEMIIRILIR
jgi:hypothetical protein